MVDAIENMNLNGVSVANTPKTSASIDAQKSDLQRHMQNLPEMMPNLGSNYLNNDPKSTLAFIEAMFGAYYSPGDVQQVPLAQIPQAQVSSTPENFQESPLAQMPPTSSTFRTAFHRGAHR